ncbi:unannotated protein [freshwater metagenome]|uniref:Unannotated protein n=1 Tax=freshwater metagenome TaxID=449393 RepID=A0A6J7GR04_9ZZZZ|nr:hypothetical protein [Rhodococcus sp. AW25M09]
MHRSAVGLFWFLVSACRCTAMIRSADESFFGGRDHCADAIGQDAPHGEVVPEQGAVRSDQEQITSQSIVTADGSVFAATVTDMFEQIIPDVLEQIQQ